MLTAEQIAYYHTNGFLAIENVLPMPLIEQARRVVEDYVERSREIVENDTIYDLEPGHSAEAPRLRRLKEPCGLHPIFREIGFCDAILDRVADLIGPGIRFQTSKLNLKSAAFGSPVQWHQDFAFYPHTNDDLLAVGIALDDCMLENGCMLMLPGSHRGPIYSHHEAGVFVGAVDAEREDIDLAQAVPVPIPAGGITLHHCRTMHASAPNTSSKPRRLFLVEMCALDAWPVLGTPDLEAFNSRIKRGEPTTQYRVSDMQIRIPLPKPAKQGSIYEIQTHFQNKVF